MALKQRIDSLVAELAEIHTRLSELPEGSFPERAALRDRRALLRKEARELGNASTATHPAAAHDRLTYLKAELNRRMGGRLSQSAGAQTGVGGGIDPKFVHRINRKIDDATNVEELRGEIWSLERMLASEAD
jgi:hypothetical protein